MTRARVGRWSGRAAAVLAGVLFACLCFGSSAVAAGDVTSSGCPFETEASPGFRTALPECRAYEMVSPSYGAGAAAKSPQTKIAPPISPDGEHLLAVSFGAFAGAEELAQNGSSEYGETYEFSRTPTGWSAEPQDPPANEYPFHFLEAWSGTDLGSSVWLVENPPRPGEALEPYWVRKDNSQYVLREGRGHFAVVGPSVAPGYEEEQQHPSLSSVEGVSSDLAHIAISVPARNKQLWPGDGTEESQTVERSSLYEYHGAAGGEPVLVGVENPGRAPWESGAEHVNEGAELESECGTAYDGMSVSGEMVFFTALHENGCSSKQPEENQLYARVDGRETVDLSEPSTGPEGDCANCDESEPMQEASFAGSSEDGSKVFFATKQRLLAGANGESLYEYDFDAMKSNEKVTLIAPDATKVQPASPHGAIEFSAVGQYVVDVAAEGTRVYFESTDVLTGAPNGNGDVAQPGSANLYVEDTETGELGFVAVESEGEGFDTTRDGQYMVFVTDSPVAGTGEASGDGPQLFEYDADTHTNARVSVGEQVAGGYECPATGTIEQGYDCDGNTSVVEDTPRMVQTPHVAAGTYPSGVTFENNEVAEDGAVVFSSELPLTSGAVQGRAVYYGPEAENEGGLEGYVENVYEYRGGQVYLISAADEATPVYVQDSELSTPLIGIDTSGRDVFFASTNSLVPQDGDTQESWYDAREDGGFPGPVAVAGCSGEACEGAGPVPPPPSLPLLPSPGSENVVLPEDVTIHTATKKKTKAQQRAEKLARALKACKRLRARVSRRLCEAKARRQFGKAADSAKSRTAGTTRRAGS